MNLVQDMRLLSFMAALAYFTGFVCALFALWRSRTPQGASAWVVGLLSFPFAVVPLFLIFGRNKFIGYVKERKELDAAAQRELRDAEKIKDVQVTPPQHLVALAAVAKNSGQAGFTCHNQMDLLVDGTATYDCMLEALKRAEKYILFQFYVVRIDGIGQRFIELLMKKAKQGVRVYLLYDAIGAKISPAWQKSIRGAGIHLAEFRGTKPWSTRFQINFRNHRKVVVIDGKSAFVGGLNIGDDYLGLWPSMGYWRDTHVHITGPAALSAQFSFVKDWHWVKEKVPDLDWVACRSTANATALVLHTGPADEQDTCLLAHLALIESATRRIWIANPYFVPPESLLSALELASLRGVDVRVILPSYSDNRWVMYASEVAQEKALKAGIKCLSYRHGFLHQKVFLVDDDAALVGSANLDSRSMFINFEIMAISSDRSFVTGVAKVLETDMQNAVPITLQTLASRPLWRQALARASSLASPML